MTKGQGEEGQGYSLQVPCPKGKRKTGRQLTAIYLFFFFYSVFPKRLGKPSWDN
jgi:hypothetical protein